MADCVFCELADEARERGETTWSSDQPWFIIEESENYPEFSPVVPGHFMTVPTYHYDTAISEPYIAGYAVTRAVAEAESRSIDDFNVIINNGAAAGQTVFHLHVHVVPRSADDGVAMPWSP